jgi:hypothetical protein
MLPLDLPMVPDIGLRSFELRHHVAVVSLIDQSREKHGPHVQQFLGERRDVFDNGRVEAFQDIRITLKGQPFEGVFRGTIIGV